MIKKINSLLTYLLKHNNNNTNNTIIKKTRIEGHTTQIIYEREKWITFKNILSHTDTNPNRIFWQVVEIILEQYDQKEHSLDKYLEDADIMKPSIDADPKKILKFLQTLKMDEVKQYEVRLQQAYIYTKAITNGEIELENYPELWRKYH